MSFYRNKRKNKDDDFIDDEEEEEESSEEEAIARNKKSASKKSRTKEKIDPETGIVACKISKNRKVVVREFKKKILIDIREYFTNTDDETRPTKKGIALSLDQWKVLSQNIDRIDEAIQEMS